MSREQFDRLVVREVTGLASYVYKVERFRDLHSLELRTAAAAQHIIAAALEVET